MKSLLSISILSILLFACNSKPDPSETEQSRNLPVQTELDESKALDANTAIEAEQPVIDEAVNQAESKPVSTKPKYEGKLRDTSANKIIEHGSPDKAQTIL